MAVKRILIFLSLLMFIIGCNKKIEQQENIKLSVDVEHIKNENINMKFEYPARVESLGTVDIYARVEGVLTNQYFKDGDFVNAGDILFKVEPEVYENQVNIARAQVEKAKADYERIEKSFKRISTLYKKQVVSEERYEEALYNMQSSKALLDNAVSSLDNALINLGWTDVKATVSGRTGLRKLDVGDLAGKDGMRESLTTITQLSPVYVEFSIPAGDYAYMRNIDKSNIKVEYILQDGNKYTKTGSIDFIDSIIDTATNTIKVRSIVNNDNLTLIPNEFVRVNLTGIKVENMLTVPLKALQHNKNGEFVYLYENGKSVQKYIKTSIEVDNNRKIVVSGLENGDIVITDNLLKLHPNAEVALKTDNHVNYAEYGALK